jgi:hypothetical protein
MGNLGDSLVQGRRSVAETDPTIKSNLDDSCLAVGHIRRVLKLRKRAERCSAAKLTQKYQRDKNHKPFEHS